MLETGQEESERVTLENLHQILVDKDWVDGAYGKIIEDAFSQIKSGEHFVSAVIRGKAKADDKWNWYRMTMFDFWEGYTHERRVFGYLQNIDEDKTREEELRKKAQIDALTGVYNREAGQQKICKKLKRKQSANGAYYAMFIMDLDDFKNINDTNGHMMGDNVLMAFAKALRRTFRKEDVIYRLGGDEFVVFVGKIHEPEQDIGVMMHRFHLRMKQARETYPFLYCSVGIFVARQRYSFEKRYEMVDSALYETKNGNKGFYTIRKDDGVA